MNFKSGQTHYHIQWPLQAAAATKDAIEDVLFSRYKTSLDQYPNNKLKRRKLTPLLTQQQRLHQVHAVKPPSNKWNFFAKARNLWNDWIGGARLKRSKHSSRISFHPHQRVPTPSPYHGRWRRSSNDMALKLNTRWRPRRRSQDSAEEGYVFRDFLDPVFRRLSVLDAERDCAKLWACTLASRAVLGDMKSSSYDNSTNRERLKVEERVVLYLLTSEEFSVKSTQPFEEAVRYGGNLTQEELEKKSCGKRYNKCQK